MSQALPNIYPALIYRDAPAAIDWLERAFGFERVMVVPGPDGTVRHSELRYGPGVIMVSSADDDSDRRSPLDLGGANQSLYLTVDDPDAHCARAKAAGAEIIREPHDTDYGSREYGARDPEGHEWSFGIYHPGTYEPA